MQTMSLKQKIGFDPQSTPRQRAKERRKLQRYINLKLIANGMLTSDGNYDDVSLGLLDSHREKIRLLLEHRCAADKRIEDFMARHFYGHDSDNPLRLPPRTLVLDRHGMARELSLPASGDEFASKYVQSYRVANGILHNPRNDRRTTKGTFHVAEGGLPIPRDKIAVPKKVFAELFRIAVSPPADLCNLPFSSKASCFVSLLLRPLVSPGVSGFTNEKRMEIRFFTPGGLVSNLDFVESIFGNAGDAYLPENDAGLDVEHWSGHTGAVILAPHLEEMTKKQVGLPHIEKATERQRQDGMYWQQEHELYNDGSPFKLTCRTAEGVIITLISDNYFGYCKKEVKTQISFAANLLGNAEEEHSGGVIAFASYNLGHDFRVDSRKYNDLTLGDVVHSYPDSIELNSQGYAQDRNFPALYYIPEDAFASIRTQDISWSHDGEIHKLPLLPGNIYMTPSGFRIRMEKHPAAPSWRLRGTVGEGVFCHKPCTVSGGGKSEISKSLLDYMLYGPIFVVDQGKDLELVQKIFDKDYAQRWQQGSPQFSIYKQRPSRSILSEERSLGSVIKLLTPSQEYSEEYNTWLARIPNHIYAIAFIIKRFYKPEWGEKWRDLFRVDIINGSPGHELKYENRKLVGTYLRVGLIGEHTWRTFKCRQDFLAAEKLQTEDDISASIVVPAKSPGIADPDISVSMKFSENCEFRLFQRPDDAIHRGLDKQTELDMSQGEAFFSNFEPLTREQVFEMTQKAADFEQFSKPMRHFLRGVSESSHKYAVCSASPRLIDGVPSKNPRYLQDRLDLISPIERYASEMGVRLFRGIPANKPLQQPVNAVLIGRQNNPPDPGSSIRGLAVYNPIHYQELPELFMDFIVSLTGKSPSTTGFGSEGALTKGPFNSLRPAADLNAAMVSYALTGLGGFSTAAGFIGPNVQMGHDISLLVPEIWCRLIPQERDPVYLISQELLEKLHDYEDDNGIVPASRLGYRINASFIRRYFGRVFDNPAMVFDDAILRPETQDSEAFADGVRYIAEAHETTARQYFEDGSIEAVCPPLKALLSIMAYGDYDGMKHNSPEFREMFTREAVLNSDWYHTRLKTKQVRDIHHATRLLGHLDKVCDSDVTGEISARLDLESRRNYAQAELERCSDPDYLVFIRGSLGAQPFE